jgi:hypothetical protein
MYLERTAEAATNEAFGTLDTRVRGIFQIGPALLSVQANLPTGKSDLDSTETILARQLSRTDLNIPVKTFGGGLDLGAALTVVRLVGRTGVSLGLGATKRGPYVPYLSGPDYDPGDEVTGSAGIDYTRGAWNVALDLSGTFPFTDRADGLVVYQNGKQATIRAGLAFHSRQIRASATLAGLFRYKDRRLVDGLILFEERHSHGEDLRAGADIAWSPHSAFTIMATGHAKSRGQNSHLSIDPDYEPAARIYSYGGGMSLRVGPHERLHLQAQRQTGWTDGGATSLRMISARASVTTQF